MQTCIILIRSTWKDNLNEINQEISINTKRIYAVFFGHIYSYSLPTEYYFARSVTGHGELSQLVNNVLH